MYKRSKKSSETTNFWLSYADLMAGLLFVFILLIGAIVIKSIVLKQNLSSKEEKLLSTEDIVKKRDAKIARIEEVLALNAKEIGDLKSLLLQRNTQIDNYSNQIVILQNDLNSTQQEVAAKKEDIDKYKGEVLLLSNRLTDANSTLKLKEEQIVSLIYRLGEKETRYERLVRDLQSTKAKIKSLTGVKINVIGELKKALGDKIAIDARSGALRLSSSILFEYGKSDLKEESKEELKKVFGDYIGALVGNEYIKKHLDRIIIEGHTDSDGSYLYNLELSQQRAYSVMSYLLSLDFAKEANIEPLVIASGRSYLDPVRKDGIEDKEASRRIEVQFRLKNEEAMREIQKILDDGGGRNGE
jgi:chemotaxis protein MotB